MLRRLPHALSFARALLVLAAYWAAWERDRAWFAVLVMLAVVTDILDGPLARGTGTADAFGANVDSAADMMFYLSLPAWAYMFDPRIVLDNAVLIVVFAILLVGVNMWSHATFGALGVHNKLSRLSATLGILFAFWSILWGQNAILYYALIAALSADTAQRVSALWAAKRGRAPS